MEKKPQEGTQVGPIGENFLTFDEEGYILTSDLPNFLPGNSIWDYAKELYHKQIWSIIEFLPRTRKQPIVFEFEVLFKGRYYPRRAEVSFVFDYGYLIKVDDIPAETNIVDYTAYPTATENFFTVAINGLILGCEYPEKTINGNPVGLNIFDVLLPQYIASVKDTMRRVIHKRIELPTEYAFVIDGQYRYKIGTIKPHGGAVIFHVKRIAPPFQKRA